MTDLDLLVPGGHHDRHVLQQRIAQRPLADPVRIELWVAELRPSRFTIGYELFDKDQVASRARSVCVPFDLAAGRPRRLSDAERDFLQPWLG